MGAIKDINKYVSDVISGKIPACLYVIQACQRHKDDIKKSKTATFPYKFDTSKADKVINFIENLPHTKGEWAARHEMIKLGAWQKFIVGSIFGWVKKSDGNRRFREAYVEVPRKNGKSITAAGIGLYMFVNDAEYGAEVYSGASSEKQAWEVFRPAKLMVQHDTEFKEHFGVQVNAKTLSVLSDMSRFEPVIGKPGDGSSPSCALIDEYHEHDDDSQYSTMKTGMGARTQPLLLSITTSGSNLDGPCYALRGDIIKMLAGHYDAPDVFGVIYSLDEQDDWTTKAALKKANPNYGVSVSEEFLLAEQAKAIQSAYLQNNFKTKHLNLWCNAASAYYNMQEIEACIDTSLDIEDFKGSECIVSVDLSSKVDIAVLLALFAKMVEGVKHYYLFPKFYLPDATAYDPKNRQYQLWCNMGLITVTPGEIIDYDFIQADVKRWQKDFDIIEIPYDNWNATQFATNMTGENLTLVDIPQNVKHLSEPMKESNAMIKARRLHFDGNPVMKWMFSNVVARVDANDNVFPRKERNENKIDGVVALIMAMSRAMKREPAGVPEIFFV